MDVAQAAPYIQSMTYEAGALDYDDFPRTDTPVCILGAMYSALHEMDDIASDMRSRLWFTYRWGFAPIGGEGPTSDQGWGCMLRCGQMMLAQALVNLHLGREWRWNEGKNDPKYYKILKMFLDTRDFSSAFSIHQIANMGASEGKAIGQWFGPNTIAQVLKKLAVYDEWSKLTIHVALDNTVIMEDILSLCKCKCDSCTETTDETQSSQPVSTQQSSQDNTDSPAAKLKHKSSYETHPFSKTAKLESTNSATLFTKTATSSAGSNDVPKLSLLEQVKANNLCSTVNVRANSPSVLSCDYCERCLSANLNECSCQSNGPKHWKPLLLVIPLRLGLTEINPVYLNSLKMCFALKQNVGIIGGKPNQAHWFIGTVDDELIFLDPHTCQPYEDFTQPGGGDESYHCPYKCRMPLTQLDPSIALGFFCGSEREFDDMCLSFQKLLVGGAKTPLFEVHRQRPKHWPPFEPYASPLQNSSTEFEEVASQYDSDEEFVML